MNAVVPQNMGKMSDVFRGQALQDDLSAGVQGGFGVIGYKGKTWTIKHGGKEDPQLREDGDGAVNSIEVVILKAAGVISKNYYEGAYAEGSTAPPDCFSTNGVFPDPASAKIQNPTCANCKQNAWGSKITEAGKQAKACADNKRLAVVPLSNILNEKYGGPVLLRVPPASLQDMAAYGRTMKSLGYYYYAIGTRIGFDPKEAYPKLVFGAIRVLNDKEAALAMELHNSDQVARILSEALENAVAPQDDPQAALNAAFEQPPQQAPKPVQQAPQQAPRAPQPAPAAKATPQPAPAQAPAPVLTSKVSEPEPKVLEGEIIDANVMDDGAEPTGTSFDNALDSRLAALFGG